MRGYVGLLLLLAAIWGSSFMFIKIAVDELAPTTTMALRLVLSAIPLLAIVIYKRGFAPATTEMRSIIRAAMILGVLSTALPFTLIAWGETKIDSGVAAIGNASMPIFVALLALRFRKSERATGSKAVGVVLGLIGVGVLAGVNPEGGWAGAAGTLAVIVASISYAGSTLYIQTLLDKVHNDVLAAASVTWGAIFLAPFGAAQAPLHVPSWGVIASVLALALLVGAQPEGDVLSALAVLGTALCYAVSALYAGARLQQAPPIVTSIGTLAIATVATMPLGLAQLPGHVPSWKAVGSIVALGAVGLSVAYILYFGLIAGAGASYAVLVTYLVPALALGYGAVFLDEPITSSALGGLALILVGVGLGTGTLRIPRRGPVGETP